MASRKWALLGEALVAAAALAAGGAFAYRHRWWLADHTPTWLLDAWTHSLNLMEYTLLSPLFVGLMALIVVLEFAFPARREHRGPRWSWAGDFVWFPIQDVTVALIMVPFIGLLQTFYREHLGFLTITAAYKWPYGLQVFWGILVRDFTGWLHHVVRHHVPWFWEFHKTHHAQREMNAFTDHRYHPAEYLVAETVILIPLMALAIETPVISTLSLAASWYTRFYHANIRTDLGWLRYILVTPQSHRIHHSADVRHRDKNFGVIFSFWDRLFGTNCDARGEYPETGIDDSAYDGPKAWRLRDLVVEPFRMMALPVAAVWRAVRPERLS